MLQINSPFFNFIQYELPAILTRKFIEIGFSLFRMEVFVQDDFMVARYDNFVFPSFEGVQKINKIIKVLISSVICEITSDNQNISSLFEQWFRIVVFAMNVANSKNF